MKKIKGIAIVLLFGAMLYSCFSPPEFPTTPQIEFNKVEFKEVEGFTNPDSLIVYINFKDGDGDLGLATQKLDSPFHTLNFFTGLNGELTTITSRIEDLSDYRYASKARFPRDPSYIIGYIPKNSGILVTSKEKTNPLYSNLLPPNEPPYSTCSLYPKAYLRDTVFVEKRFKYALDRTTIVDSLYRPGQSIAYYAVLSSWYIESNKGNYNITVQFQVKNSDTSFHEFDWRKEYCSTYDGRFPQLAERERPIEGTLRYAMVSTGFVTLFRLNTLRLQLQIQDRNFNKSNSVKSQQFTLNEIRK